MKSIRVAVITLCIGLSTGYAAELQWYKGNTHTHTFWSDGKEFPETVAARYKEMGYHFLALSDHNVVSRGEKWKNHDAKGMNSAITAAEIRWGKDHLQWREQDDKRQVRLMPLAEIRELVEEPGQFIMIESVELSASGGGKPIHSNPLNISKRMSARRRSDTVERELALQEKQVHDHIHESDHPIFWQINHPNFKRAINAEQLAASESAHGVEIMNGSSNCLNDGDGNGLPSVERVWDVANTLRLKDGLKPLFGCATDDTHDYHHEMPHMNGPGLAWVMVQSDKLTADAITEAMLHGDFYCSTGIELKTVEFDAATRTLAVEVLPEEGINYTIHFIGSTTKETGKVLETVPGVSASYSMTGDELFVRARVECDAPPVCPYDEFSDIVRKAWTQPVGWK